MERVPRRSKPKRSNESEAGGILHRTSKPIASGRARWLDELAEALDEAHRLALLLGDRRSGSQEAVVLRVRIQAVRAEVDALRRGRFGEMRREIEPDWTQFARWARGLVDKAASKKQS